ncbi:MAG: 23S rRNA (guanosine(2251)-2'-O)-methyltransferase RlmB [Bdellovibrionales bacterium]
MKNNKPFTSRRKHTDFRRSSPSVKTREDDESRPQKRFYTADKSKSDFRSEGKPKFGNKARPAFRSSASSSKTRDGEESRPHKPFYKGARTLSESGDKRQPEKHSRFPNKRSKTVFKSDFRSDERPRFGGKPRFKDKARPAFRKPKPDAKEEAYKPSGENVLIWGLHAARMAFLNPKRRISRLWLTEGGQKLFEKTVSEAREDGLLIRPDAKKMEREALDRITPPNSVHQGIVIETEPLPEAELHDIISVDPAPDLILMLDQVTDPHNVGAIMRSAAAFGAGAVVMTERNAPSSTGVLAKAASGALDVTPMIHVVNLARTLDDLREAGYWCVGLAEEGEKNLNDLDLSGRTVLVLGAEGEGLRHLTRQKCDELARLPTQGPVGSLNVSNAAAVAMYEVRKQAK